jgi:hypothetical protein
LFIVNVAVSVLTTLVVVLVVVSCMVQSLDDGSVSPISSLAFAVAPAVLCLGAIVQYCLHSRRRRRVWQRRYRLRGFGAANALRYAEREDLGPLMQKALSRVDRSVVFDVYASTSPNNGFERGTVIRAGGLRGVALASYLMIDTRKELPRSAYQQLPLFGATQRYADSTRRLVPVAGGNGFASFNCSAGDTEAAFGLSIAESVRGALVSRHFGVQIETLDTYVLVYFPIFVEPLREETWREIAALLDATHYAVHAGIQPTRLTSITSSASELTVKPNHRMLAWVLMMATLGTLVLLLAVGVLR